MNEIRTFNPKDVTVIYNGRAITGFAEDSVVRFEKNEDNMIPYVGAQGEVSVAINADNTGMATIELSSTSPFIRILSSAARSNTIAPFSVIDMNDAGISAGGTQAWIVKSPDISISKNVESIEVQFFIADYSID